jgi:GntR family transcriptional regulator
MPLRRINHHTNGMLPVPMYHQIYLVLKERLAEGAFEQSRPLPSEHDLAAHFGVSRVTMRGALNKLQQEGLILRQRGRGTFPRTARPPEPSPRELTGLFETLMTMGRRTTVRVVEFGLGPAQADVARALAVATGDPVWRALRIRSHDGRPLAHLVTFVPEPVGRAFGRSELAEKPMLALLEESGVRIGDATQTISARLADGEVAQLLGVELGAPLLSVNRVVRDSAHRPVQLLRGLYRPDRYQYQMHLPRSRDDRARIWVSAPGAGE